MASAIVGALRVILSLDSAEFNTEMKRTASAAKEWSNDLGNVGRQATAVGSAMTRTLTLPLVGLGLASVKAASDFESSFAGVRKTVDATEPEFAQLAQGLRDMSKEIPTNVNELNRVAESAGQLGIKKNDIIAFTRTMADLGVTTNLTAEEAATATAQIQNIFGAAGKDVDRFGATLVALGNAGASTEKDIVEMGVRIAKAGTQVGLSQHQVLAFASSLASIGIEAEAGGSAISRVFLKINDAVAKGGEGLAEFARVAGMSSKDFKAAFERDAATATVSFIEGLKRLKDSGENVNATLEGVVGKNIILKSTLMGAAGAGSLFREQLELGSQAWEKNSALTDEANKRYQTFDSQLKVVWNQVKDVAITFGTALLPALRDLVGMATPVVGMLSTMADMFAALPSPIRTAALGFGALVAAAGPAIWIFGQVVMAAGTIVKAFTAKGIAMQAITKAWPLITGALTGAAASFLAIGGLATALALALFEVGKAFVALYNHWNSGKSMWEFFSARDDDNFVRRWLGLSKGARDADIALTGAGEAAKNFVGPVNQAGAAVADTGEDLKAAKKDADEFAKSLKSLGGKDALAGAQEVVKQLGALGGPLNVMPAKLAEMADRLRDGAQAAALMGKTGLADQYTKLAATLTPMVQFQQRYNVTIGEYVTQVPQAASWTEELVEQIHRLGGEVTVIGPKLKSSMVLPMVQFKEAVRDTGTESARTFAGIGDAIKNLGTTILSAVTGGGNILSAIGSSLGKGIGEDLQENLGGFLRKNLGRVLGDAVGTVLPGVGALLGPALGLLGKGLGKLFGFGANDEIKRYNGEIDKVRQTLIATHGPLDQLEAKARAVGLSFAENWGHQGKAGLEAFNKLVDEFNKRWAELEAQRAALGSQLQATQGDIDGLIGKARELGYEFDQNGKFIGVTFEAVRATADQFGISIDSLGTRFSQQALDQKAAQVVNAFELLDKAGGDTGGILVGLKEEIGALVGKAIAMGGTVPKQFEPWVKELMRTDQLVDENGQKITDLSQLKFGEPVKTEFEKIATALQEVVNKLADILAQIAAIPTQKTVTIQPVYGDPGPAPDWAGGSNGGDGFAVGTMGRLGTWFGNFPSTGLRTALHGVEAVVTREQAPAFAMDVLSSMGSGSMGGSSDGALISEIQGLRRDLQTTIPAISETAARHGAQTAGRRR